MERADARIEIRLLGTLQVSSDGAPAAVFTSDKERALLAFLVADGPQPYRRELLAGLFWPESSERAARASLRNALAKLRRSLHDQPDDPLFEITYQTVALRADAGIWLDLVALEQVGAAGAVEPGDVATLEQTLALYGGAFMDGFTLADCAAFEEWLTVRRQHYHQCLMAVCARLADLYVRRGEYAAAIDTLRRQLDHEPWREETHRRLMELLASSGRRSEALHQFRCCRRILATELGVAPDHATVAVYTAIRDETGLPEVVGAEPTLPALLTPLVGRVRELADLTALYAARDVRMATLVGSGGIGKTHLALAWAHSQTGRYPDGVGFVYLADTHEPSHVFRAIGLALGLDFAPGVHPRRQLADFLHDKRMLLVLDNLEHLSGIQDELLSLLREAPHLSLLATSRRSLSLQCEHVFRLDGLGVPTMPVDDVEHMGCAAEAVQLFIERARRVAPDFALDGGNVTAVVEICRAVQGMPLGIILAAGWLDVLTPREILAQLEQRGRAMFTLLESDAADLPVRHRSLWAVIDSLWSMLSAREKVVFAGLSIFRDGFDYPAAHAVTDATPGELRRLVAASCLQRAADDEGARYSIHALLRQYAWEHLHRNRAAEAEAHERHAGYYIDFLAANEVALDGKDQTAVLQTFSRDGENIRAAWTWAAEHGQVDRMSRGLETLCRAYDWLGYAQEGEAACLLAAAHVTPAAGSAAVRLLARIDAWLGVFCSQLADYDAAHTYREQALALLDQLEAAGHRVDRERAAILLSVGWASLYRDDFATLDVATAMSRDAFRRAGYAWGEAQALELMGWAAHNRARYVEALNYIRPALAIRRRLDDVHGMGWSLAGLGQVLGRIGHLDEARRALEESLAYLRMCGDRRGMSGILAELACVHTWSGDPERGTVYAAESDALVHEFAMPMWIAVEACSALVDPFVHAGRYGPARTMLEAGMAVGEQIDSPWPANAAAVRRAKLALVDGDPARARRLIEAGISGLRSIERTDELGDALALQATCAALLDDGDATRIALAEAVEIAKSAGHYPTVCAVLAAAALSALVDGQEEDAVALYAVAMREPFVANSCYFKSVYGVRVAQASSNLSSVSLAAARTRFHGQNLQTVLDATALA